MMTTRRALLASMIAIPLRPASLPEQSAVLALDRAFPDPRISYLLLYASNGRMIGSRWDHPENPAPVGSLVKPFTALAYRRTHDFRFPSFVCRGEASQCWLPKGHGSVEITRAIAHSCNAYFLELARDVSPEALAAVAQGFGLNAPDPRATPTALIGLGETWPIAPISIARAYCELVKSGPRELLAGMALSARLGTGRGVGAGAYAKTGTAPCIHESREMGDGYVIALYPSEAPRYALLVRVHGVPGAQAAVTCGRMRGK